MIIIISQDRCLITTVDSVERDGNTIFCRKDGNPVVLGKYDTSERAKDVFNDILDLMLRAEYEMYSYRYSNIEYTTKKPKRFFMPSREGTTNDKH